MKGVHENDDLLIDLIYSAMLGETSWQTFLDQMSLSSPGSFSVMFSHDVMRRNGFVGLHSCGDQAAMEAYDEYYYELNPWAPHCAVRQPGISIIGHDIYPQSELMRSEFYCDFLSRLDVKSTAGCTIDKGFERTFLISTMTVDDDPDLIRPIADQFSRLAPHLKRAADFYRREPKLRAVSELGGTLFDAVNIGMVMIGEGSRVKAWSEAAQQIVADTTVLRTSPFGRVTLRHETAQAGLHAMLGRAYDGPKQMTFTDDAVKTTLVHVTKDRLSYYFEGPTVILLLERPGRKGASDLDIFSAAHGLTKSETRALAGILAGKSAAEIARESGLSRETIRSQVKSLYARLDVRSEAELLRLHYAGKR
jgi:DNA-binding CsgD family transcriptional regulator